MDACEENYWFFQELPKVKGMDPQSPERTLSAISDLNNKAEANSARSDECKWAGEASTSHQVHQLLTKHHTINM